MPADGAAAAWLRELNLDPVGARGAGLGVLVVQAAPGAARRLRLGAARRADRGGAARAPARRRRGSPRLGRAPPPASRWTPAACCSSSGRRRRALRTSPQTLHAVAGRQNLPAAFSSPSFRRLVRPGGRRRRVGFPGPAVAAAAGDAARARRRRSVGPVPTAPGLVSQTELVQQVNKTPRTAISRARALSGTRARAVRTTSTTSSPCRRSSRAGPVHPRREPTRRRWSRRSTRQQTVPHALLRARLGARRERRWRRRRRARPSSCTRRSRSRCTSELRDLAPELLLPGVGDDRRQHGDRCCTPTRASSRRSWSGSTTSSPPSCCGASSRASCAAPTSRRSGTRGPPQHPAVLHQPLGPGARRSASPSAPAHALVLVIRGELLRRYPTR